MKNKILVVDDDPCTRRVIRRVLRRMEHEVIEAEDGDIAVQLVQCERPPLVLLDMHMPRLDGIEALSRILEIDPSAGVIMITGDRDLDRAKLAMERGACDYITKPFDLQYLATSVAVHFYCRTACPTARV